ncbi:hypothetical protein PybrP1_008505 [[Pythium] brassicae (nom. inval.)]|nr:hypothetical protein PybrP1_008505 [[Pythium] brassicae (nom. inval.)]
MALLEAAKEPPPPLAPAPAAALEHIAWDELDKRRYFVLGPTMFLAVRAAVYPSNLVKTRLQVQSRTHPLYTGTFDAFRKIARQEGFKGFYKGFGASTANVLTGNVYISVYELARKLFLDRTQVGEKASNFAGGACASLVSQTIVVPLDIVSQRMMIDGQGRDVRTTRERPRGFLSVTKLVYRTEGLRGFYRGYLASIATYAPSSAIWWGTYGLLVPVYYNQLAKLDIDPFWNQVASQALSGGSAGFITAVSTNPMDIVRTKAQVFTQYGALDTLKYILQRDGVRGLMTGVTARVLANVPSGVLVISSYDGGGGSAQALMEELRRQLQTREQLRAQCAEAPALRAQLASGAVKLKADIKKSGAFVKKLRMLSDATADSVLRDAAELNLTRYVSECVAALADAPLKVADVPAAVRVAALLHGRYEDFAPALARTLVAVFDASYGAEDKSKLVKRRILLRLLAELVLAGVLDDAALVVAILQRVVRREGGAPARARLKGGAAAAPAAPAQLEVPLLVSFAKAVGVEFLGVRTKRLKEAEAQLGPELAALVDRTHALVPAALQRDALACFAEAFDTVCKFYLAQHAALSKLAARNEREEANRGEVSDPHAQELEAAKLLFDKLQTSVNALADALDRAVPPLPLDRDDGGLHGGGLLLWEADGSARALRADSAFGDEDTRAFYEDLPDLLVLVPAVVLGLSEADLAELKKKKEAGAAAAGGGGGGGSVATATAASDDLEPENDADDDGGDADDSGDVEGDVDDDDDDELTAKKGGSDSVNESESTVSTTTVTAATVATAATTTGYNHQHDSFFSSLEDLVNRDRCDKAAVDFCYRNSKANRSRLVKTLFSVPRTHLELLPYYARLVATLQSVLKEDLGGELVALLVNEFTHHIKKRNQFRLESKVKNIRFLAELTKFKLCPPNVGFRCLKKCFADFQGHNVVVATAFLETCGRFLYCAKHAHARTESFLAIMMKLKAAKHLDPQAETLVQNAYYTCKPPARVERAAKQHDPRFLFTMQCLYRDLDATNANKVVKTLRKLPWQDPQTTALVLKAVLKVTKGKVMHTKLVCDVVKGLARYHDELGVLLVDDVLELVRRGLEMNDYRDHQHSLGVVKLLGELYNCALVNMNVVLETLYLIVNHSHDLLTLPEFGGSAGAPTPTSTPTPTQLSATAIADAKRRFLLVPDMRFDPRVPSAVDGPTDVFRIRLVCALIEACNGASSSSSSLSSASATGERGISKARLGRFLVFFQRYLFSKTEIPLETDFVVVDLFEALAGSLKDQFKKVESWEEADAAVQAVVRSELEEAERRLAKKNAALAAAHPGRARDSFGDAGIEDDEDDDDDDEEEEEEEEEEEQLIIHDRVQRTEEDDEFEKAFKTMMQSSADARKLAGRVNVDKMAIPTVVKSTLPPAVGAGGEAASGASAGAVAASAAAASPFGANGPPGVVFRMLRRGNKGKVEARQLVVPEESSLAQHSHRQENAGKKEQSEIKRLVLQTVERDDYDSDAPPTFVLAPRSSAPLPAASANPPPPPRDLNRTGFGISSEWNNDEFGLRRGRGYRGSK